MSEFETRKISTITRLPYWWAYISGIVLLLISVFLWWTQIHLGTKQVFWGMLENSLSTQGVTIETAQKSGESEIKQLIQVELGTTNRAHSLTTLKQGNTEVKTEIIGTRDTDYTRYRSIKTDQKNAQGEALDVSKIVNVWSRNSPQAQTETQASGNQLLAQAVLGVGLPVGSVPVPIGKVTPGQREDMMRQIRNANVYETDFVQVKKERKDGRLQYAYDVKMQPILYVRLMKEFAQNLGFKELDGVDPNTYQSSQPLNVKLIVDAHSRQLTKIENGQNYQQSYMGYGLPLNVEIPKNPISASELQQRLTEL